MKWKRVLLSIALSIVNSIANLRPIKSDKITMISLEGVELKDDLLIIKNELQGKYQIKEVLYEFKENTILTSIGYFLNCLKQAWHISDSKLVLLSDNNFAVSKYKRPGVKVVQVWHANGAVKKFGNEIDRRYKIANYDYVLANSEYWKPIYAKAFGVKENQVKVTGLPKIDRLYDLQNIVQMKEEFYNKYPQCRNKKILLYAPTFRGNIYDGIESVADNMTQVVENLGDEYILLHKAHPLVENRISCDASKELDVSHEELYQLLVVSDILISDYSSIIFDYSLLKKPIILYAPDLQEYKGDIGLSVKYDELPGHICSNIDEMIEVISAEPSIKEEKLRYFDYGDGMNIRRVTKLIEEIMD